MVDYCFERFAAPDVMNARVLLVGFSWFHSDRHFSMALFLSFLRASLVRTMSSEGVGVRLF